MAKILVSAESSLKMAELLSANRGRRDQAYIEYAVSRELITGLVPQNHEYPDMVHGSSPHNEKRWRDVKSRLAANEDRISNLRQIILSENTRTGVTPSNQLRLTNSTSSTSAMDSLASSRPSSVSSSYGLENGSKLPPSLIPNLPPGSSASPKQKPSIRPKPEALHGTAIHDLQSRFAALRPNAPTNGNQSLHVRNLSEKSVLRMPSASDFRPISSPPPVNGLTSPTSRPNGPRPMLSLSSGPRIPPKIPIDTALAASMPRPPSPAYSPARNMQTPASVDPPRTTPRSIVGTGGRSNSLAAAASARTSLDQESGSYFPRLSLQQSESRRNGVLGLPAPADLTIDAERLFDYLKLYNILLIDVRSRQEFDEGHIDSSSIICVEPLQLRIGMSASDVENSLSISPDDEEAFFAARDKFQIVVYYDQSTQDTNFQSFPKTESQEKLRTLYEALWEFNIDKPLKNPPMILIGGLDAWVDLLGQSALKQSQTQVRRGPRRRSSVALPDSLIAGKKRVRGEWNPLNPEEERQWAEQARSESFHLPKMTEQPAEEDVEYPAESTGSLSYIRSEEEFFRRYPAIPTIRESMSSTTSPPSSQISFPQAPYSTYHSEADSPEMPSRPPPAAPRVSYSGAHDRNAAPFYNAARTRHPPPYISPKEKPANVRLPRTGLVNFGTTCYMNSIIQCLNATVPLVRRFQDGSYKQWVQRENWKGSRGLLPEYFANLVSNLWLNDVTACRPLTFRVSRFV
jgi:ubiquitin carboxyl-terminal hydrolase 8